MSVLWTGQESRHLVVRADGEWRISRLPRRCAVEVLGPCDAILWRFIWITSCVQVVPIVTKHDPKFRILPGSNEGQREQCNQPHITCTETKLYDQLLDEQCILITKGE